MFKLQFIIVQFVFYLDGEGLQVKSYSKIANNLFLLFKMELEYQWLIVSSSRLRTYYLEDVTMNRMKVNNHLTHINCVEDK